MGFALGLAISPRRRRLEDHLGAVSTACAGDVVEGERERLADGDLPAVGECVDEGGEVAEPAVAGLSELLVDLVGEAVGDHHELRERVGEDEAATMAALPAAGNSTAIPMV